MNVEVKVPAVGESITSGILSTWHKKDGEAVNSGDILFTLETDKVSTEVNAPESGILRTQAAEGDEVKIDQVVAIIEPGGTPAEKPAEPAKAGAAAPSPPAEAPKAPPVQAPPSAPVAAPAPAAPPKKDEAPAAKPKIAAPDDPRTTRKKLTPLRRKIAAQLVMAQHTAAILTTFNECDMSGVMALRKEMQEEFTKRHGVKLGFMSFFIKSVVDALKAVPAINSRIDGDDLVQNKYYDIGVAVGTEKGLIVPVLRNCDEKSFGEIESDLVGFATKAREGKMGLEDLQGGVFTISNGGVYGSLLSTPILNPPQSGILGMHKIQERPVAEKGQIAIRPMMFLALSYDHRVVDGKEAVTFLIRVKDCIENPARLLLGT
ncbi:MAG TPA: dihydrolipoyllysine-residue succinyltransferase [Terrimicrobiaceae bacterium]|nr:dihydrolipoyllysine-residue succinyltransferase [Terrimicrobiaceae bacterium]